MVTAKTHILYLQIKTMIHRQIIMCKWTFFLLYKIKYKGHNLHLLCILGFINFLHISLTKYT